MATWMTGIIFLVITLSQWKVAVALLDRRSPDPLLGNQAIQRSAQNNYLPLSVVLLMISKHYPILFAGRETLPHIAALVTVAGALVRYFHNVRHADHERSLRWACGAAAAALTGAFALGSRLFYSAAGSSRRKPARTPGWNSTLRPLPRV